MRGTQCVQEERNKRKRYERREGEIEKDEADKKKIAGEIDGEKSEGREGEKRIASSRPQQRTQHPWLVLSHARIRFAPSEFQKGHSQQFSLQSVCE